MKNNYLQALRGVAIIAVITIHSYNGSISGSYNDITAIIIRCILNFTVPLFFFISGYLITSNIFIDIVKYYKKRFFRLLSPYIIWSIIYLIVSYLMYKSITVNQILKAFIFGKASSQFYFILLLLGCVLVSPILFKLKKYIIFDIFIFVTLLGFLALTYKSSYLRSQPNVILGMPAVLFYYMGIKFRGQNSFLNKLANLRKELLICCTVILFFGSILEGLLIYKITGDLKFGMSQFRFASFAFSIFLIMLLMKNINYKIGDKNVLSKIGDLSLGIFFIHILIIKFISATKILNFINNIALYYLVMGFITLVLSYVIIKLLKIILHDSRLALILGLY
jgi:probable poly-beta-1,6-N-acetyl-D-glucosamine export protein